MTLFQRDLLENTRVFTLFGRVFLKKWRLSPQNYLTGEGLSRYVPHPLGGGYVICPSARNREGLEGMIIRFERVTVAKPQISLVKLTHRE